MTRSMRIVFALTLLAVAALSGSVDARELPGLQGVVRGLGESGSLLLWGTALAGLSTVVRRPKA